MTATEFLQRHILLDGRPVQNVVQITLDAEKATLIYDVARQDGGVNRRAVTAETEAVTIE